jgi:glycosyltransferase involved in cell wall biosynthesis
MSHPLISVVLCSFNGEKFIKEQVDSILNQTYTNLELIISDDASTDSTLEILRRYQLNQKVKLHFQKQNIGPTKNFDYAIRRASGEFIACSDQDDIWLPEKIERLHAAIEDSSLIYSDSELVDEKGTKLNKKLSDLRNMYSGHRTTGFIFSNVVWGHALMFNRKILPSVLPIPDGIPHDIWIAYKAATVTGIKYLDQPLTLYRQHQSTATRTIATKSKSRTQEKLWADFKKQLHWIEVMRDHAAEGEKEFYHKLFELYTRKESGKYVRSLFSFLMKNRERIFMFTKKTAVSQVIEIWKQAKGIVTIVSRE